MLAVCVSREKGTQKQNVGSAHFIEDFGIEGDAHAGKWHRQVSLLSHDKIEAFRAKGAEVIDGAFGENLVVTNLDFRSFPVGTRPVSYTHLIEQGTHTQLLAQNGFYAELYNSQFESTDQTCA